MYYATLSYTFNNFKAKSSEKRKIMIYQLNNQWNCQIEIENEEIPNFSVSIYNLFVTFVSYLKEYGRAESRYRYFGDSYTAPIQTNTGQEGNLPGRLDLTSADAAEEVVQEVFIKIWETCVISSKMTILKVCCLSPESDLLTGIAKM